MRLSQFINISLIFLVALVSVFYFVQKHYNEEQELRFEVSHLSKEIKVKELERRLALHRSKVFRSQVAQVLPDYLEQTPKDFHIRNLASVVNEEEDEDLFPLERATDLIEEAKYHFQAEQYQKVIHILDRLLHLYPNSTYAVEANFLKMESLYQLNELEQCLEQVEIMLHLYPENSLTGFSMVRMGNILERYDRIDDAITVYKNIQELFPNEKALLRQTHKMLQDLL